MKSPFILRVIFLVYLATAKTMSTTPESVLGSTGDALNIKEFLSTADPIWTYNSTQNTKILCKVDQERGIMEENYSFNRSYYVGYHNWTTLNGEGTFNEGHFTEMNVNLQGYKYKETLLYTDNYTSCAIVLVTPTAPAARALIVQFYCLSMTAKFDVKMFRSSTVSRPARPESRPCPWTRGRHLGRFASSSTPLNTAGHSQ
uniref:Putative group i salivary lipocalin n=1 Tax=Rhipicephalus pulchellus TaxID=72859 RepID=L7LPL0_RHIPC